ncbi:MAG: transposase [Victivallaceae bacterium]|nr:transposase [Victivallaceae bacterium]
MSATTKNTPKTEKINSMITTAGGTMQYQWEKPMPVTMNGYLPFFSEYLYAGGRFDSQVNTCPLEYKSNNAPQVRDVLGTAVVSILNGYIRYRQAGKLYGDEIPAQCLNMKKFVSYDSLRRAFVNTEDGEITAWLEKQLLDCCEPLLGVDYILDQDPTVKVLYGNQEGAELGYNPKKPGRPSHCLHTFCVAGARLLLNTEVRPGNETAGKYSHDGLWNILARQLPRSRYPKLIRGDIGFGNDETMSGCEARQVDYLFKLRQSANVKKLIDELSSDAALEWLDAGKGWQGCETRLQLMGWTHSRRVIVLRRLAEEDRHMEASTSRETLQNVIGRLTNTGGRRLLHLSATGCLGTKTMEMFERISAFLKNMLSTAPQLNNEYRWARILTEAFKSFLHGEALAPGEIDGQFVLPLP